MELHEFNAETALNEEVKKFIDSKPSLAIMNGDMHVLDGHQGFKQIKEIDSNANVIIVTRFSEFEPKSKDAIKVGRIKVISKPFGIDKLLVLVRKYTEAKMEEEFHLSKKNLKIKAGLKGRILL